VEQNKQLPLSITDLAYQKIIAIRREKKISGDYALRLGVKSAGCGIASYVLAFDHQTEKDERYELADFSVIIEKIQVMYLAGKKVDYDEVEGEIGFVFRDAN
jgi:iron-sulfur cluster assembly accessory protein